MDTVFMPNLSPAERLQIMKDNCDKIEEKSYTKKFTQEEINLQRAELADTYIKINELEVQLAIIKEQFKNDINPLKAHSSRIIGELKAGGKFVTTDVYKFIDYEEEKALTYDPDGMLLEARNLLPEERQANIFHEMRRRKIDELAKVSNQ